MTDQTKRYLERSKVREIICGVADEYVHVTEGLWADIDALPIFMAGDFAASRVSAPGVEGWQWVPKEMTQEMIDAALTERNLSGSGHRGLPLLYQAMLAASPSPRAPSPDAEVEGWQWVPKKLTAEMIQAACDATFGPLMLTPAEMHEKGWEAMLAASPSPRSPSPDAVVAFATAILHGDNEHREWLLQAAYAFVAGEPLPPVKGKGSPDAGVEGWQWVPKEPTLTMVDAGAKANGNYDPKFKSIYRAMLAASPSSRSPSPDADPSP